MLLLNDLLDLAKLESGKMEYVFNRIDLLKVITLIEAETETLVKEKGLTFKIINASMNSSTVMDQYRIGQVLRNLVSNAIKFTESGKTITIRVDDEQNDKEVEMLTLSVIDEGIGIPVNEIDAIFDKFAQSSKTKTGSGGTGLGLAICKEIIAGHNGRIAASNNPMGGAIFTIAIPRKRPECPDKTVTTIASSTLSMRDCRKTGYPLDDHPLSIT